MSPEQYGRLIHVSGGTVRRVEAGYIPFLSTQEKFAKALGTTHLELFGTPPLREPAQALTQVAA